MGRIRWLVCTLFLVVLLCSGTSRGQQWSEEQADVWKFVQDSWAASTDEDPEWTDKFLHPEYQGWSTRNPMPIGRAKLKEGLEFDRELTTTHFYQIDPVRIVIHEHCAVVHYYVLWFFDSESGKDSLRPRRVKVMETFVRDSDSWLSLASHWADIE